MFNFGYVKSTLDGSEHKYNTPRGLELPESYSHMGNLPDVIDQGPYSICVPCSISTYLNWRESLKDGGPKDIKVKLFEIYNSRTTDGEGMTFKDAFHFLSHWGVKTTEGITKINQYAMIRGSIRNLKSAIVENGPCVGALPVYGENYGNNPEFWKRSNGSLQGGHAIAIIGYTPEGFIIRNSWGKGFGENGYCLLKNEHFHYLMEAWTVIA